MKNPLPLMSVDSECRLLIVDAEAKTVAEESAGWSDAGLIVRAIRGRKMRAWQGVFDEFAAALQFPWYFGENIDALSDCITDLGWLPREAGYVILINSPTEVLADAGPDALGRFVTLLNEACQQWAQPVEEGEWWDRPAMPFHVVLHASEDPTSVTQQWSAAGGKIVPFPG